jgi:hypothetical protein
MRAGQCMGPGKRQSTLVARARAVAREGRASTRRPEVAAKPARPPDAFSTIVDAKCESSVRLPMVRTEVPASVGASPGGTRVPPFAPFLRFQFSGATKRGVIAKSVQRPG